MNEILLDIRNLQISFRHEHQLIPVLNGVDFTVAKGEIVAVLGNSGSGKTLTAMSIMQLLPDAALVSRDSVINFQGNNLLDYPEAELQKIRGKYIGIIFQEPMTALNPVLTIGEQINEAVRLHLAFKPKRAYKYCLELLQEVGFDKPEYYYSQYPHQLSGGMRQRVVIATAIAARPGLLIADEPTSALDVTTQAQILDLLGGLCKKYKMALLFITHDLLIAQKLANKVVVIKQGKSVLQVAAKEFFASSYFKEMAVHSRLARMVTTNAALTSLFTVDKLCIYFPIQKGIFKRTVGWVKAVDEVSLKLYPGKTLGLVGESGCGKSTLAKGMLQLVKPTGGSVVYKDKDLLDVSRSNMLLLRKDLQIVFQDPFSSLNPRMLVSDIIAEGLWAQKLINNKKQQNDRVDRLLQQVGLPVDCKHRYPHEFSGGQRQRIGIARALAVEPQLIICDEPTSALDNAAQDQIINLLQSLQVKFGLSYLFITHDIDLAVSIADEIAVMQHGKIVEYAATQTILSAPQHPYTKMLFGLSDINVA